MIPRPAHRLVRAASLVLSLLASALPTAARADAIDDYVQEQMRKQHVPGVSVAVVQDGKVVKARGYGVANVELDVPATAATVYEIGSVTKQFTAVATMMLVEQGKVGLDDKIGKYVEGIPTAWEEVTVRQLLTHTSGIKSYTSLPGFNRTTLLPATREDVIKSVASFPLEFPSGTRWNYSNTGYYLLGHVIEKASGKSYAAFLQERVFTPLKMDATRVNDLNQVVKNRASGYERRGAELRNADAISMTWPYAAGALVSTVEDLAKWDLALSTERMLKNATLDLMWTPVALSKGGSFNYGLGWELGQVRGHRTIRHGGGIPGFTSFVSRFPEQKLTVIVLTNLMPGGADGIAAGIAGLSNTALTPPQQMRAQADPAPEASAKLKEVLGKAAEGTAGSDITGAWKAVLQKDPHFTGMVKEMLKEGKTFTFIAKEDITNRQLQRHGERVTHLAYYRMTTSQPTVYWTFYLTPQGKLADAEPTVHRE